MDRRVRLTMLSGALFIASMFVRLAYYNLFTRISFYILLLLFIFSALSNLVDSYVFNGLTLKLGQTKTNIERKAVLSVWVLCIVGVMIVFADWIVHFVSIFK